MNDFLHKYGVPDVHFNLREISDEDMALNANLKPHHIDRLIGHGDAEVHLRLGENRHLHPHYIDRLIDIGHGDNDVHVALSENPSLKPHHIDHLINTDNDWVHENLSQRKDLSPEQRAKLK